MAIFTLPNNPNISTISSHANLFPKQTAEPSDTPVATSYLGTPIYDLLIFQNKDTGISEDMNLADVLLTVSQSKNIVKTQISGRAGTVKEYISLNDFQINVQGYLIGVNPNEFPKNLVALWEQYMNLNTQISVASNFLSIFDITSVVVDTFRIAQQEGFRNAVPFTMSLISDEDIELQLSDDANSTI